LNRNESKGKIQNKLWRIEMNLGIAYYPEYNDRENWEKDFRKIHEAGIRRVRMGEFAWSLMEPRKGVFNWQWLDESIEIAARYGIEIILGTPTACPPIWLVEEYEEVLPVNKEGRRSGFGARQHRCYNSQAYIKYASLIVEELGKRYGKHANVVAWQIDNELGGEQKYCYCEHCKRTFQNYIKAKYTSVEELNRRWCNNFWSQNYENWLQIPVPMSFASDLQMKHHPSLMLEFYRFSSDSIVSFSNMQAEILRKYTDKPITTNTDSFLFGDNVNLHELFKKLDVAGIDIYTSSAHEIGFYSDLARSLKGEKFWMMEYGTGSHKLYEEMKLIKERNCEWFCLFTYKPFKAGQEQGFKGLVTMTGEEEVNYGTIKRWAVENEAYDLKPFKADVGLFYDFDSSWAYSFTTWSENIMDKQLYPKYIINTVYKSLFELNKRVEFLFEPEKIRNFKTIIIPWKIIYDEKLEEELIAFVNKGGKLVVTTDFFRKNRDNVYLDYVPKIYREAFGWEKNDFINEDESNSGGIVYSNKIGEGQVLMLSMKTSLEEWSRLFY
jgi:beta-galactosidase